MNPKRPCIVEFYPDVICFRYFFGIKFQPDLPYITVRIDPYVITLFYFRNDLRSGQLQF